MPAASNPAPALMWFRDDLRLADNPALSRAAASGRPLVCVYVFDPDAGGARALGGAAKWWLHHALEALDASLAARGGRLVLLRGAERASIEACAAALGAGTVYWNRRYDAAQRATDSEVKASLKARGLTVESCGAHLLNEPWTVLNASGEPFQVFSAYWRACRRLGAPALPLPEPQQFAFHDTPARLARCETVSLRDLQLIPQAPDWAQGLRATWRCSEEAAREPLRNFIDGRLAGYAKERDRPDHYATSRLSPYLRFGNVSAREIWHAAASAVASRAVPASEADLEKFTGELGWREFSYYQLYHFPELAQRNVRAQFDAMPWRIDDAQLQAWQQGRTGYPLVDAGMRELWTTGWMHNRVRMVTASFLVKHLLIDWRAGERWFWDTLVDADPASNAANWQWVAGSGADAAPYFRIFNPVLQGEKFDPLGDYVRRWVPELARLPAPHIHSPWRASAAQLSEAGVRLGIDYPHPIVAHDAARERALLALARTKGPQRGK